jgi:hypothetical protein
MGVIGKRSLRLRPNMWVNNCRGPTFERVDQVRQTVLAGPLVRDLGLFACFMAKKMETRGPFVLVRCSVDRQVGSDSMVI